jgi:tetratricopeptide (TPR) repeat protein
MKDPSFLCELYMILAESHAALNDRERAVSHTQLALRILDAQHDTKHLAWSLFCRGKLYLYKSRPLKAAKQFQLALILRRKMGAFDGEADCLLELGSIHHALGAPEEARPLLEDALALYEKSGNLSRRVAALSLLGEVLRLTGDYPECRRALGESLRRQGLLESRRVRVQTLLTFAGLCTDKGDLSRAERYLRDAQEEEAHGSGTTQGTVRALSLLSEHALHGARLGDALECASQAVAAAREVRDPSLLAAVQAQQSLLLSHVGRTGDARRMVVSVLDIARRHELPSCEGWARLLEAVACGAEGKLDGAQKLFGQALGLFWEHAGERDLARLYLEQGLLHLRRGQLEDAYLGFEEGLALARKLHLTWLQSRFHVAIGLLEMELSSGDSPRAEEEFLEANAFATRSPYPEILWQTHFHLGRLLIRAGKEDEGVRRLRDAFGELKKVLGGIPAMYREPYLTLSGGEDLVIVLQKELRSRVRAE